MHSILARPPARAIERNVSKTVTAEDYCPPDASLIAQGRHELERSGTHRRAERMSASLARCLSSRRMAAANIEIASPISACAMGGSLRDLLKASAKAAAANC